MRFSKLEKSVTFHSRADTDTNTKLLLCEAECESLKLEITSLKQDIDLVASCFTCVICMRIEFPVYWSSCCKIILGCVSCISQWVSDTRTCPHCRSVIDLEELVKVPEMRSLCETLSKYTVED